MDMSTTVRVSLEEYLSTEYEPDCEYIDGIIEDRNVGKNRHSRTQTLLSSWLFAREKQQGHKVLVEQRIRISSSRVRIPDICLVDPEDTDEVIQHPPALWIEILSPEDRWSRVQAKIDDVLHFGVPTIWVIDPYAKQAWIASPEQPIAEAPGGKLHCANLNLELGLNEILPEE